MHTGRHAATRGPAWRSSCKSRRLLAFSGSTSYESGCNRPGTRSQLIILPLTLARSLTRAVLRPGPLSSYGNKVLEDLIPVQALHVTCPDPCFTGLRRPAHLPRNDGAGGITPAQFSQSYWFMTFRCGSTFRSAVLSLCFIYRIMPAGLQSQCRTTLLAAWTENVRKDAGRVPLTRRRVNGTSDTFSSDHWTGGELPGRAWNHDLVLGGYSALEGGISVEAFQLRRLGKGIPAKAGFNLRIKYN